MAEDVTMEDVARIMREEDAHLLESMHFEQSCSTGATPTLTSIEGRIDSIEEMPLMFEVKVGEPLSITHNLVLEHPSSPQLNHKRLSSTPLSSGIRRSASLGDHHNNKQIGDILIGKPFSQGDLVGDVGYRQCLSGEIKRAPPPALPHKTQTAQEKEITSSNRKENIETNIDCDALPEGDETTTSSTCYSHNATASPSPSMPPPVSTGAWTAKYQATAESSTNIEVQKRRISRNDRRIKEAEQFAQAVGEMPPMDSNELCIIEEDDDDDTDDDDDGDDGNGTVIRLDEIGSQLGSVHDHMSAIETTSHDAAGSIATKTATTGQDVANDEAPNDIPREIIKRKSRPQWPLRLPGWTFSHLDSSAHANLESTVQDFVYKGIHSNPPEIVSRGISRGNHVQLHRKAWLEVSDKYHRYGKNLRLYYRHWESLGYPMNMFFDWLDSKGEAAGQPLPNLEECPRSKLDSDTVLYITNPEVTNGYALTILMVDGRARLIDVDGEIVGTGPDGWIFVLRDGVIYGAEKITSITGQSKQRFHHSSFFGGKAVAAAGIIITDDEGFLVRLYPHSGHYRPREAHMQRLLYFLYHQGVDLRSFDMDVQQIFHVSRDTADSGTKEKKENDKSSRKETVAALDENSRGDNNGDNPKKESEKKKKIDSLQLMPAVSVACYVAHKAHFIGQGIFAQIHQIRNANVTSVTEALEHVNG